MNPGLPGPKVGCGGLKGLEFKEDLPAGIKEERVEAEGTGWKVTYDFLKEAQEIGR